LALLSRYRLTVVMPVVKLPVPEAVKVTLVKVVVLFPGLLNWNCSTGKVTPANWLELEGGTGPIVTGRVTGVEVNVAVDV
jgi:hypothetical protein